MRAVKSGSGRRAMPASFLTLKKGCCIPGRLAAFQLCLMTSPLLDEATVRVLLLTSFVTAGLSWLPVPAHAAMDCGQANPAQTRAIFEQGEYAKGSNRRHTRYKAGLPTITERADRTCTAIFPLYVWATDAPAGNLTVQLEILYLPCVPDPNNLAARYRTLPPGTLGSCPFIHLKDYPAA